MSTVTRYGGEELPDLTETLTLRSKRTERYRKKQEVKTSKNRHRIATAPSLLDLPFEILVQIFTILRPSDIFRLFRTNKALASFLRQQEEILVRDITAARYPCLSQCFRLPVLLVNIDPVLRTPMADPGLQKLSSSQRGFQHIAAWDRETMCSCGSCILRWNTLCLAVDFAHWQDDLDQGRPLPLIERGKNPAWNQQLVEAHASIVRRAFSSPLWHARILEAHLESTIRSIRRHAQNAGNRRRRFHMTKDDERDESDAFLEQSGPPSLDVPFHRDNYYMLEAYLPNRSWITTAGKWMYVAANQHDRDIEMMAKWWYRLKEVGKTNT